MWQIVYVFILIVAFFIGHVFNFRKDRVSAFMTCLYLLLLMGGQTNNPDYYTYQEIFSGPFYAKDPGYGLIMVFLRKVGFTAYNFKLGIAIIGFVLISITVFRLVNNRMLFYLIYGIYPFLFDVVQSRNFLVMSILIFSMPLLIKSNFQKKLIFIALMIFAASIQKIALLYIPLVFVGKIRQKKSSRIFSAVIIFVAILAGFSRPVLLKIVTSVATVSGFADELSSYTIVVTRFGWLIFWAEQIFAYLLIKYANKIEQTDETYMLNGEISSAKFDFQRRFIQLMQNVNYYMFIFLPLFILNGNYTRIIRNITPLNIIAIIIVISAHSGRILPTKRRISLLMWTMLYEIWMFYLMTKDYWDNIIVTTFTNNWIWK